MKRLTIFMSDFSNLVVSCGMESEEKNKINSTKYLYIHAYWAKIIYT